VNDGHQRDDDSDTSITSESNQDGNTEKKSKNPKVYRVALHPTEESVWTDICMLNEQLGIEWSDDRALELESRILLATAPPLCLEPSFHVSRVTNAIHYIKSTHRPPAKRKWNFSEMEEEAAAQAENEKLMLMMDEVSYDITKKK
jgi:hypothetical protein